MLHEGYGKQIPLPQRKGQKESATHCNTTSKGAETLPIDKVRLGLPGSSGVGHRSSPEAQAHRICVRSGLDWNNRESVCPHKKPETYQVMGYRRLSLQEGKSMCRERESLCSPLVVQALGNS